LTHLIVSILQTRTPTKLGINKSTASVCDTILNPHFDSLHQKGCSQNTTNGHAKHDQIKLLENLPAVLWYKPK